MVEQLNLELTDELRAFIDENCGDGTFVFKSQRICARFDQTAQATNRNRKYSPCNYRWLSGCDCWQNP